MKPFAVYILCNNRTGTLYIGITNDLQRRMLEHKNAVVESFTKRYGLAKLVHVELYKYVNDALRREKQLTVDPGSLPGMTKAYPVLMTKAHPVLFLSSSFDTFCYTSFRKTLRTNGVLTEINQKGHRENHE